MPENNIPDYLLSIPTDPRCAQCGLISMYDHNGTKMYLREVHARDCPLWTNDGRLHFIHNFTVVRKDDDRAPF